MSEWISVKGKIFKEGEIVDIWSASSGRLPDYRYRKDYKGKKGNNFFEPVYSGISCVRDVTHWMPLPPPPKESTNG